MVRGPFIIAGVVVEASDRLPLSIDNCPYKLGENVTINYKQEIPAIECRRHRNR
jgi:hypothetical protein